MRSAIFVLTALAVLVLWLLAFLSMKAGNPTAVNAVVGIPAGCLFASPLFYIVWRISR